MNDIDLMYEFQTLGEDCEFSFIQRRVGAEPLELFRFGAVTINQLIIGFHEEFSAIGDPKYTEIRINENREVWAFNSRHKFSWHLFENPDTLDVESFREKLAKKMQFMRRKFLEDIEEGKKIFIFKRRDGISLDKVQALHEAVQQLGPTPMLWVVEQSEGHEHGFIEWLSGNLMKGYIGKFTPHGRAAYGSIDMWLTICRNTLALARPAPADPSNAPSASPAYESDR